MPTTELPEFQIVKCGDNTAVFIGTEQILDLDYRYMSFAAIDLCVASVEAVASKLKAKVSSYAVEPQGQPV